MRALSFDLETTGVDVKTTRPVQVSLVSYDQNAEAVRILMNALCNPLMEIEDGASAVHGITAQKVVRMPDYQVVLFQLAHLVRCYPDHILVTMNGKSFDLPITKACLGYDPFEGLPHFDVLQAAYRYFPDLTSRKLGDLYAHFFGMSLEGAHDATADALASVRIAREIAKRMRMSVSDLIRDLDEPKPYSIMPFGKHKGLTLDQIPVGWARYMTNVPDLAPDLRSTVDYVLANN
jgi:DNA polymerase III epsilon subunit-like protein